MKRWAPLVLAAILIVALCVRLVPAFSSPYPYNVDGYPLVKGAERAISDGHWDIGNAAEGIERYNAKMPLFSYMLASLSVVFGIEPMRAVQLLTALLGVVAVLLGYALAKKVSGSETAALACAAVLALSGFFVYLTAAAMKEALGLALLLLAFLLYMGREDPKHRMLLAAVLLLLPLAHHLTALVALLFITIAAVSSLVNKWRGGVLKAHGIVQEIALGPALLFFCLAYYQAINMEFYTNVSSVNEIALFGAIAFLGIVVGIILSLPAMTKPWMFLDLKPGKMPVPMLFDEKTLAVLIGIAGIALNSRRVLFQGTLLTSDALLAGFLPILLMMLVAIVGYNLIRYSSFADKGAVAAMALAPIAIMEFSVARGLDPFSFSLAYRAFDYLDPFIALGAGVGIAFLLALLWKRYRDAPAKRICACFAVGAAFVLVLAATTPLAYESEQLFGVRNETLPQEFSAGEWASSHNLTEVRTNSRYYEIYSPYFGMSCDPTLPYVLKEGRNPGTAPLLLSDEWTADGAQSFFSTRVVVSQASFDSAVGGGSLVYCAGPAGRQMLIVLPG
ncbi:MAG: glycosyltransferase family 39 protein [Euryarchaeota archaeon]|nr:glycosyltransferase family 39 protein [Euryarchaeota archaeon]